MLFFIIILCISTYVQAHVQGTVSVDSLTFNKLISRFPYVLAKFDERYPYGDKQKEFQKFVGSTYTSDLLVLEVPIAEYGEQLNLDLARRFKVQRKNFPTYFLFKDHNTDSPTKFDEVVSEENLKKFIKSETGLWMGPPGTLERMDEITADFMRNKNQREVMIQNVENSVIPSMNGTNEKANAEVYLKIMDSILKNGDEWLHNEIKRVKKLLEEKLTERNKLRIEKRFNVLQSFADYCKKEEL